MALIHDSQDIQVSIQLEMSEKDVQSVLRCKQCNKPFDKESTLKRHGYYCRSRGIEKIPRSRSCLYCARTKTRCDKKRPECSRCKAKGTECHYISKSPKARTPSVQNSKSLGIPNYQETEHDRDTICESELGILNQELADFGEYFNWDVPDVMLPDNEFGDFLNLQSDEIDHYPSGGSGGSLISRSTPPIHQKVQIRQPIPPSSQSIPAVPTSNPRSFIQRSNTKAKTERTATLIRHMLKSYVLKMLRHNSLPPFIHPYLVSAEIAMEPLDNCINLVHMISGEMKGGRKLFWRNVRMECERLCAEHLKLTKWELLAAMQALSIYIIIRLDEGETDYNGFDSLLFATVILIAQRLMDSGIACNYSLHGTWQDWLFEESRRRLSVVYRVVNMLFYFEPAAMCNLPADLILAPLPGNKQLWEASNERVWKLESESQGGVQTKFGLAGSGELVRLGEECSEEVLVHTSITAKDPERTTANWEEWCEGMDGLGGLVMLVASMVI